MFDQILIPNTQKKMLRLIIDFDNYIFYHFTFFYVTFDSSVIMQVHLTNMNATI